MIPVIIFSVCVCTNSAALIEKKSQFGTNEPKRQHFGLYQFSKEETRLRFRVESRQNDRLLPGDDEQTGNLN